MLDERANERCYLGQFIPVHYHHNMLMDRHRMQSFKSAIAYAVRPGATVVDLGGGTGVLSFFAAQAARKVYCVEYNPELVREARRMLAQNRHGERVEVIEADALLYMPPEPVDVVICEMIHVGMLREKQVEVIEAFKRRYLARFGAPLPLFIPEAVIMAAQPVQQDYDFDGYHAPIIQFQNAAPHPGTLELAAPSVYSTLDFSAAVDDLIRWRGVMQVDTGGTLNAMRFVTKNVLAVVLERGTTIDWLNHYMTLPLHAPLDVAPGDALQVSLSYRAGDPIAALQDSLTITREAGSRSAPGAAQHR